MSAGQGALFLSLWACSGRRASELRIVKLGGKLEFLSTDWTLGILFFGASACEALLQPCEHSELDLQGELLHVSIIDWIFVFDFANVQSQAQVIDESIICMSRRQVCCATKFLVDSWRESAQHMEYEGRGWKNLWLPGGRDPTSIIGLARYLLKDVCLGRDFHETSGNA